jgi:glyoxylase-like metal-dependent hydrolase (beta-lactamase superfamily II)
MNRFFALALAASLFTPAQADEPTAVIHRVTSHIGWDANAFIVEGPDAVFVVDALFLLPDVHALADRIERIGKPVEGLLLTHPHQDHFGGLATLRDRLRDQMGEFPIYASEGAIAELPVIFEQFIEGPNAGEGMGVTAFSRLLLPDHELSADQTLTLAGIEVVARLMGPGESADAVVFELPGQSVMFIGDIVMPYHHQYVGEGRADAALAQIDAVIERAADFDTVLSGHGDHAPAAVLEQGRDYVAAVIAAADAAMAVPGNRGEDGHLTREARAAAVATIVEGFRTLSHFGFGTENMTGWNIYGREMEILAREAAAD